MIACYIIYSEKLDRFYIGITQEDIVLRIINHNTKAYGTKYTSQTNDWTLFYFTECTTIVSTPFIQQFVNVIFYQ